MSDASKGKTATKAKVSSPGKAGTKTASNAADKPIPTRELNEFCWWLKNGMKFNPEVVIDVGAAGGTPPLSRIFTDAFYHAFEPLPQFIEELKGELSDLDHKIYNIALMDKPGWMEITQPDNLYTASLMATGTEAGNRKIDIEVSTLDKVFGDSLKDKRVLLKTDCQGGDLDCVKGGTSMLQDCDVVIMEASLYPFWGPHHPIVHDIVFHMKEQGFVLFDVLGGLFKPSNRALGQVDLVFAQEDGPLRPYQHW